MPTVSIPTVPGAASRFRPYGRFRGRSGCCPPIFFFSSMPPTASRAIAPTRPSAISSLLRLQLFLDALARVAGVLHRLAHLAGRASGLLRFVADLVFLPAGDLGPILGTATLALGHGVSR